MGDQTKNPKKVDLKIGFFKPYFESDNQRKIFKKIYEKNNGNWSNIKPELKKEGFTAANIDNLEFAHHLVSAFQKDGQINSMRDIAVKFNKVAFIEEMKKVAPEIEEDKNAFALNLYRKLFYLEPTAMLVNMIRDQQVSMMNASVAEVLSKQLDFNIKTTSIYEVIKNEEAFNDIPLENHETVITQLKTLQRITAISTPDALPVLYNANLHSAMQISAIPQKQFIAVMSKSGLDDNTLMQIHSNAQQARVRNEQAIMALKEVGKGTYIDMIDKSMVAVPGEIIDGIFTENLQKHNISWDFLFGDADFCECDECNSVYSAAAYYVELLEYLRNNNLDPSNPMIAIKNDPKDISGTPLEKLFDRRPDLGCLELTCKNTNTILPYIDLVNEVMENYVAFTHLKPFNVEDEVSSELLAEPQHTEYKAYCILKNQVYPFTLPYHQPIDAERIYLKHLDTSRYELIKTFRKNNADNDLELARLKDEALDRAVDAEFLGLTMEEYVILTKECFESKDLIDKLKNKIHTDHEYQKLIGVRPVWKYYGFEDDIQMLGDDELTLIKKEFLLRTGIDYFNLVDMLKTEYINPCMPKGKSKTIMESLHFSYRFLQNYAKANGIDKMAEYLIKGEKLAELMPLFKEQIELLTNKKALDCPKSKVDEKEISDKDIIHWVKCQFEKVGKMIVIESGIDCVNGKILIKNLMMSAIKKGIWSVEECQIFVESNGEKRGIGSIDRKSGKVSLEDPPIIKDKNAFKNYEFIGEKGEKGDFLVIDNEIYLVFKEQKDSCDLNTALFQHLDGTPLTIDEYDRIHRFIRLWRKLGWTIYETDQAIVGLSISNCKNSKPEESICSEESICYDCSNDECNYADCNECEEEPDTHDFDINTNLIHQLVAVKKLVDKTGLELIKLLSFWNNISTVGEKSLYQRLFLTHNVLGIDKVFKADDKGMYLTADVKLHEHVPVVMAALNLSADDIQAIMQTDEIKDEDKDKLTLDNLSTLYRYRLLSKVLGLRIPAFVGVLPLFGKVFQNAHASLEFMEQWEKMEAAGFTHQQLNYIIMNEDDKNKPFTPTQMNILQLSKTLYDGLNAIDEVHKDLKADDSIPESKKLKNIQEQATSSLVRTKISLLFDTNTVEKIMGILEGTNVYMTKLPKEFDLTLLNAKVLKNKLKCVKNEESASIQITGILTDDEAADYNTISNKSEWINARKRIEKQQDKLFKELLSGIFENKKARIEKQELDEAKKSNKLEELADLEGIIKSGDITIPIDEIKEGEPDKNTAPKKRVAFLEIFLPYLREQLTHRFVIDALANFTELDTKITDVLVSEVLNLGSSVTPIYSIFEKIKESTKPDETNWSGYLIPAADTDYTFIIKNSSTKPIVNVGGEALIFKVEEDPAFEEATVEWWSNTKSLQAGKLYKLSTADIELKSIFWKTPASAITSIPSSALIPDFASEQCKPALIMLKKAAMLVSTFDLSVDEIKFLNQHNANFDELDFNKLELKHWLRLEAYVRLRNSLQQAKLNMLDFWNWAYDAKSDENNLIDNIVELTSWKKESIKKLITAGHFNIGKLKDYYDEKSLLKLQQALMVSEKIGIDIDLLFEWAVPVSKFKTCRKIADSIKNAIRAKYNQTDWEQVVKPLHDQLRNNQKEALIGYLLQQDELIEWNVTDTDGLFEYFLIDVQMEPCMETSRIKQAISSVQLFVQRCFLGLEKEHNRIEADTLDRVRWNWMQNYRVWEANRKVFLYPENWIESNLRDDKSPFFKELESELLQKDINKQNVADALKSYLYKVDEVANMEVIGVYIGMKTDENGIDTPIKLHIFSRTRNAPYLFYYRLYDISEGNWYPWEKMQVDIPSYDVSYVPFDIISENAFKYLEQKDKLFIDGIYTINDSDKCYYLKIGNLSYNDSEKLNGILQKSDYKYKYNKINDNGCYLTPVSWNGRLLIFFPQIMKKTQPNTASTSTTFKELADEGKGIQKAKPSEYYEIKMAWSEYRNGKWTQKQISKDAVYSDRIDYINDIQFFKFVPIVYFDKVVINVDDNLDNDGVYHGAFEFNGTALKVGTAVDTESIPINYFNKYNGNLYSWQIDLDLPNLVRQNKDIYFYEVGSREKINGLGTVQTEFDHPYTRMLLGKINLYQLELELFFRENQHMGLNEFGYHELKRPYSLYNWELFFHTPILLADALSKAQQYEEAMKWFHFVFNPIADGNDDKRFWEFSPFKEMDSQRILNSIFNNLASNTEYDDISEWRDKPFMPHVVARRRPVAYMKWVIMKYIDNLLAWGDYLFRQDTIESINQAIQLYVLAGHILGAKPMMIPKRGKIKPQTYLSLLDKWDPFGNAMVELEITMPFSNQPILFPGVVNKEIAFANIYGSSSSLYFCIPNNPKLMGYWDTLANRLFKIRNCQNIEGVFRKLPLFEPPIDPALLVKAAAQGLSIASVLNDLNTPMPNYRFYYLLQKALELCNELKSLGSAMLSAIEKKDNETIALIRAKHEGVMQNLVMEIKKKQLEEAEKNIESLKQNRKTPEERMKYYLKLSGQDESLVPADAVDFNGIPNDIVTVDGDSGLKLIEFEKEEIDKAGDARWLQVGIGSAEILSSSLHMIPSFEVNAQPFGTGTSYVVTSGSMLGNAAQAITRGMQVYANDLTYQSSNAGKKGGFKRALQERIFQANAAGYELKQIDKQITAQQIRIDIANKEITNQQKAIDNANEVEEFIKNKYSSEELYAWIMGSLKILYHQVYNLAYELAKKAEKTYCFERGISSANFIQPGYFDAGRDGLMAGEQLYLGLKQLEAAYQNERGYEYEITKQISLYQINPLSIIQLRETGKCEFALPEVLFDMDYPGHYKRRIKSVSVSIPCIAGPYTGINSTFTLLENKFRNTAIGGKTYEENTEETDVRFSSYAIPINAIATSSAQNDSGMFELNFKDERYLPFEGAGVISKWRLELPTFKQFDYHSISDVIIHLKYTACEGGERLKLDATNFLKKWVKGIEEELKETGLYLALDMKHDLPNEWHLLKTKGTIGGLIIDKSRLPYMAQPFDSEIDNIMFVAKVKNGVPNISVKVDDNSPTPIDFIKIDEWNLYRGINQDIKLDIPFILSIEPTPLNNLEELMMIVKYKLLK